TLCATVRHHPKYKESNWDWFTELFDQLPSEPESERLRKRATKYLPYHVLCTVADQIEKERVASHDSRRTSWLIHDELLIRFLLTLVWRQRNVRECRLGSAEDDNLFFAELPTLEHVAR